MRIGLGYDVHALAPGYPLVLAGATIPFNKGLVGHTDGDVLTHALIDALLGAAAIGDIGQHFPSSDPRYKNMRSLLLLEETIHLIGTHWRIINVDATIIAEHPPLRPFIKDMRANLSEILQLPITQVSIKAKTTDGLGFTGNSEGIAAEAVALIQERIDE